MRAIAGLGAVLAASLSAGLASGPSAVVEYSPRPEGIRRRRAKAVRPVAVATRSKNGSIALCNRWTGHPHEHKREIARRLRQLSEA